VRVLHDESGRKRKQEEGRRQKKPIAISVHSIYIRQGVVGGSQLQGLGFPTPATIRVLGSIKRTAIQSKDSSKESDQQGGSGKDCSRIDQRGRRKDCSRIGSARKKKEGFFNRTDKTDRDSEEFFKNRINKEEDRQRF
jgi:hypothetical protein